VASISKEELEAFGPYARANPGPFCRHFLGADLWSKQVEILESVRDNERTAVVACHSIGKSYITACCVMWFLLAHPGSKVIMTSPTWRQVIDVLWSKIRELYTKAPVELPGQPLLTPRWEIEPEWCALGFASTQPERLQGFHAPEILVIVDEASGVPAKLFAAIKSMGASGEKVRYLYLSNPTRPEGELFDAFHKNRSLFSGGLFQVSAWDTPNLAPLKATLHPDYNPTITPAQRIAALRQAPCPRPYLIRPKYVADAEEECGWDSDYYRVRVLGQFPRGGADLLIPLHLIEDAMNRWENLHHDKDGKTVKMWWDQLSSVDVSRVIKGSLDVARFGTNDSVFGARLEDVVAPIHSWNGLDTVQLTGNVQDLIRRYNVRDMVVDEDGLGGGPYDNLRYWGLPGLALRGFQGGKAPHNRERYGNLRAEAWHDLAARFADGRIAIPRNDKLTAQISCIRYFYRPGGQRMMESKDDMVKDGRQSPDIGDMLAMLFLGAKAESSASVPMAIPGRKLNAHKW